MSMCVCVEVYWLSVHALKRSANKCEVQLQHFVWMFCVDSSIDTCTKINSKRQSMYIDNSRTCMHTITRICTDRRVEKTDWISGAVIHWKNAARGFESARTRKYAHIHNQKQMRREEEEYDDIVTAVTFIPRIKQIDKDAFGQCRLIPQIKELHWTIKHNQRWESIWRFNCTLRVND